MWGGGGYNRGMKKHNLYRGFTIIEVVLVLAIAGLIFLMIFLALPDLQRSRRNEQRKRDMGEIAGAIQNYRSANKGKMPKSFENIKPYIRHDMRDPDGDEYDISIGNGVYGFTNKEDEKNIKLSLLSTLKLGKVKLKFMYSWRRDVLKRKAMFIRIQKEVTQLLLLDWSLEMEALQPVVITIA